MTTIRVASRQRFTSIDRKTLNDSRLSFRARGVLAWLLDKPDNWTTNSDAIAAAGKEGRDAIRVALRELEGCGYLKRERVRGDRGRWFTETLIYERPPDGTDATGTDFQAPENPPREGATGTGPPTPDFQASFPSSTLRTKTETPPADGGRGEPKYPVALPLVKAWWDDRVQRGLPVAAGRATKKGNPFMGLVQLVQDFLDAGWTEEAVTRALTATRAYTRPAIEFVLREAESTAASKPSNSSRNFDAIRSMFDEEETA